MKRQIGIDNPFIICVLCSKDEFKWPDVSSWADLLNVIYDDANEKFLNTPEFETWYQSQLERLGMTAFDVVLSLVESRQVTLLRAMHILFENGNVGSFVDYFVNAKDHDKRRFLVLVDGADKRTREFVKQMFVSEGYTGTYLYEKARLTHKKGEYNVAKP